MTSSKALVFSRDNLKIRLTEEDYVLTVLLAASFLKGDLGDVCPLHHLEPLLLYIQGAVSPER